VAKAHPQLNEPRFLAARELEAFSIVAVEDASGPITLQGYRGQDNPILRSVAASLDSRLERINRQQYYQLSVVRRDATYGMCGTTGTLVLSGKDLAGAPTPVAVAPIERRLYAWGAGAAFLGVVITVVAVKLCGASIYFRATNPVVILLALLALALAVPPLGAALRALRPGFQLSPLRSFEKYLGVAALAVFGTTVVVGVMARPRVAEVEKALSSGNVPHARVVLTALQETNGSTGEVTDAEDRVMLAEAKAFTGELRLQTLDQVAARRGRSSAEASTAARAERLSQIRGMIERKTPAPALAAIERWYPATWKADAEVAEERARAHDLAASLCVDDPCRVQSATLAQTATPSGERAQRLADARASLLGALATRDILGEETLVRLKRLRGAAAIAKATIDIAPTDVELVDASKTTIAWTIAERAKVALLGAEVAVVEELLETTAALDARGPSISIDGTRAFLVIDAQKKCRGVYVVGEKDGARAIRGTMWTGDRLLSQAVGHGATVRKPDAPKATVSRWFEVSAQVTARWHGGELVELRVGDATP
jgi:hypothetical protein